ncbi:L,D-transpeptidase [Pseudonocardia sp. GCM10023141]|uniref:L,D-transpeptidase n=1 Tax=Pseudonocardia sp. GCM10023141 TaxID=3252653 RepID=UPI00361EB874
MAIPSSAASPLSPVAPLAGPGSAGSGNPGVGADRVASFMRIVPADKPSISPRTPIVVQTSGARITAVAVTDTASGAVVAGSLSPDAMSWTSSNVLGYGSTYRVNATAVRADGGAVQQTGTVRTVSPATQTYPSLIPAPSTTQTFGVGQIIGVSFDHPVTDRAAAEKALSVTSTPEQTGGWYWIDNRTVHYRPQTYWQPGSTVTVHASVFGVNLGGGAWGQTDRTVTYRIHDAWIAKADGATEQLQIFHNGTPVMTMPMSLGSPGFPSHSGPHVISDKQPSIIMDSCTYGVCQGQPGYYREQVALDERISNDGEFVHSAPWSVGQQGTSNVSHGCVNLSPTNAQWFYDHFGLGDVVEIINSGGPPLPLWDTYGDWEMPWNQWRGGNTTR